MSLITVKSKGERFRRAGIEFSRAGVELDTDELTQEQVLAIASEPQLVTLVDGKEVPRPDAAQLADMRTAFEQLAAEKAADKQAAADVAKAADEQAAADAAKATETQAAADEEKAAEERATADAGKAAEQPAATDKKTAGGKKAVK